MGIARRTSQEEVEFNQVSVTRGGRDPNPEPREGGGRVGPAAGRKSLTFLIRQ